MSTQPMLTSLPDGSNTCSTADNTTHLQHLLNSLSPNDNFLKWMNLFPFLVLFSSNEQMELLKTVCEDDVLILDGTFEWFPSDDCQQFLTIHVKKHGHDTSLPCMFIFLDRNYCFMWWVVRFLVPELAKIHRLNVVCDFDVELQQEMDKVFEKVVFVGSRFHLMQAIDHWTAQHLSSDNPLRTDHVLRSEMLNDLLLVAREEDHHEGKVAELRTERHWFAAKWKTFGGAHFIDYVMKMWVGEGAVFPLKNWSTIESGFMDSVEKFHQTFNSRVGLYVGWENVVGALQSCAEEIREALGK